MKIISYAPVKVSARKCEQRHIVNIRNIQ